MNSQVDDRLGTLSAGASLGLWTTRAFMATSGPWVRNTNAWVVNGPNDLDFTGVSPYKVDDVSPNGHSYQQAGTLISPRHMIMAYHYFLPVGAKVIFVNNSNVAYERTVTAVNRVSGPQGANDLSVALLNADVPDSITYYPVIASSTFIGKVYQYDNISPSFPIVSVNQWDQAFVHLFVGYSGFYGVGGGLGSFAHLPYSDRLSATSTIPNFAKKKEFSGDLIDGDSGDANFMLIGGRLAFLGPHNSDTQGYYVGAFINEINAIMAAQGGGYQLTELDIDCFDDLTLNHAPTAISPSGAFRAAMMANDVSEETFEYQVDENLYFDTLENPFYKFAATDLDGHGVYFDTLSFPAQYFSAAAAPGNSFAITLSQPLSRSNPPDEFSSGFPAYLFSFNLRDNGTPAATSTYTYFFSIKDNNRPLFSASAYAYSIAENSTAGTAIGSPSAELQDDGDTLAYSLLTNPSNAFAISASTGQITVADASFLNYEATTSVNLIVQARATLGGSRSESTTLQLQSATSTARVAINLTDIDETPTPPVLSAGSPAGVLAAGTTGATLSVTTNESSVCKYDTSANTAYASIATMFSSTGGTTHAQAITGLSNGNTYTYYVRCADGAGSPNLSDYTILFSVANAVDSTAPVLSAGSPSTVLASDTTATTLSMASNEAATCKYGTTPGLPYASMASVFGTTGGTAHSKSLTGLANGTSYAYYVRCVDGSSNANSTDYAISFSVAAAVDTTPSDTAAPVLSGGSPSTALSAGTAGATLAVTTNENATCRYGTTASTAYASIANAFATTGGTSHSHSLTGLADGTAYLYYVRCTDASSNANGSDYVVSFSVSAAAAAGGGGSTGGGGGGGGSSTGGAAITYYPAATSAVAVIYPAANAAPAATTPKRRA